MKKLLTIGSLIAAGTLISGCTLQNTNNNHVMMSGHSMNHDMDNNMMMHDIENEEEFIINMIPHHQEAVDTAQIVVAQSTNSDLKKLAQNIIDAQTREITMMNGWLQQRYPNSTIKSNYQNMMPELTTLTGDALDTAFLQ